MSMCSESYLQLTPAPAAAPHPDPTIRSDTRLMVGAPGNSLARGTALAPSYRGYWSGHLSTPAAAPVRAGPSPPLRSWEPATDRAGRTRGWWGKGRTPFQFSPSRMPCDAAVHSEGHSLGATWPKLTKYGLTMPKRHWLQC